MMPPNPPDTFNSAKFGCLQREDLWIAGERYFHYCCAWNHARFGALEIVFHPDRRKFENWERNLREAEARADRLLADWPALLLADKKHIKKLFKRYSLPLQSIEYVVPDVRLKLVKLITVEDDELIFAPCRWFPSFDLCVTFDRKFRVTYAHFDG